MSNLPLQLTYEHSQRLQAVLEDARKRVTDQLLDQGYSADVVDLELAFAFSRMAAKHGIDIADIAKARGEQIEAMNRALFEELKAARELEARLATLSKIDRETVETVLKAKELGWKVKVEIVEPRKPKTNGHANGHRIG